MKYLFVEKSKMTPKFWLEQMEGQSCHFIKKGKTDE